MSHAGPLATPPIRILILGPPVVTRNENPVRIIRREIRAFLYFLASSNEPVSRSTACDLFWNQDDETSARKKLREGLSRLRAFLVEPDALITEDDYVSLNPSLVYIDYSEFHQIVTPLLLSSEMMSVDRLPDWLYGQLKKAMQLCRGNQFLQGFSLPGAHDFESWLAFSNHAYAVKREKILRRLIDHAISMGNFVEALLWIGKALETDPLNTDLNFLMLTCLKETGHSREAADYLSLLETRYRGSHLEDLPKTIKDFKTRLLVSPDLHRIVTPSSDWPGSTRESSPFVGRVAQLAALSNAYYRKGLILINGESGCGKSRLVKEFFSRLPYQPKLLLCNTLPAVNVEKFRFLIDGLRPMLTEEDLADLPVAVQDALKPLLFPSGETISLNLPGWEEQASIEEKQGLFLAFLRLLEHLAADKPFLMVVENAQWLDLPTLELLSFLNEAEFFKNHGLLVLTARSEEINPGLDAYLDWSVLVSNLEVIDLPPLSLEETGQLTSQMFGNPPSQNTVEQLWRRTGGNPFYLVEIINALREEDFQAAECEGLNTCLPASVSTAIKKKLRFLNEQATKILACTAVAGEQVDVRVLEEMACYGDEDFLPAVEELLQLGFLKQIGYENGGLALEFFHGVTREVVLQGLSMANKRSLHMAAVCALEKIHGANPEKADVFARHYEQAGDFQKAFDAFRMSGKFESSRFERERSYSAFQKAAGLLTKLPIEIQAQKLRDLIEDWGNYAYDLDDLKTCRYLYELGMKTGETNQDPKLIAVSLLGLGRLAEMQGNLAEGIESLNRALFFLKKLNEPRSLIETYSRLGFLFEMKHEFKRAKEVFEEGLKIERDVNDPKTMDSMINLETRQALLLCMMGYPAKAEEIADITANESLLVPRQSAKIQAYATLATARLYGGKFKQAIQNANSVYQLAQQYGLERWETLLDLVMAKCHLAQGHLDECWIHVHKARAGKNIAVMKDLDLFSNEILGDLYRLLGDLPAAEELYRRGAREPLDNLQSLENYFLLGLTQYQLGKSEEGLETIRDAARRSEALGLETVSLSARLHETVLSVWISDPQEAIRLMPPIVTKMIERGCHPGVWNASLIRGEMAMLQGDMSQAREELLETIAITHEMGHQWIELWALTELATMKELDNVEKQSYHQAIADILVEVSHHAQKKPLRALFHKFEKKTLQNLKK